MTGYDMTQSNSLKLKYFFDDAIKIHIRLSNGRFYNGEVIEFLESETIIFLDQKVGRVVVLLNEIEIIEEFTEAQK